MLKTIKNTNDDQNYSNSDADDAVVAADDAVEADADAVVKADDAVETDAVAGVEGEPGNLSRLQEHEPPLGIPSRRSDPEHDDHYLDRDDWRDDHYVDLDSQHDFHYVYLDEQHSDHYVDLDDQNQADEDQYQRPRGRA